MIKNPNKIMARLRYSHVPKRCRNARYDSICIFADTKDEARERLYENVWGVIQNSKRVNFETLITYQPAKFEDVGSGFESKSYALYAIPGQNGCTSENFDEALAFSKTV